MAIILVRYTDIERWKKTGKRVLVYGRRKTGKTFFLKNFTSYDEYFFVKRDGEILDLKNMKTISYEYLKDLLIREREKRVIIDEFHRLPEEFLDFLQAYGSELNLVLVTSTLWLSRKILGESSPLLGIFEEFKIDLIDERDVLKFLKVKLEGKKLIDTAIYLREPWLIPLVQDVHEDIPRILIEEKNTIERLIVEIFREEERQLKSSYISILSAISSGRTKSSEISSFMFSRKILPKDDPSIIQPYLKTLSNIGIIEKIKILNKKFDLYVHKSPLLDIYFLLDSKYGFSEIEIPQQEVKKIFEEKLPFHAELFFGRLFSKIFGLKFGKIMEKDYDIDVALFSHKKLKMIFEIKWKNFVNKEEIGKIENVFSSMEAEKFLVVPEASSLERTPKGIEVVDVNRILELIG